MKNQLRRLHLIFLITEMQPEDYYCITTWESTIQLQGHIGRNIKTLERYDFQRDDGGYYTYSLKNVKIVLT